MIIRNTTTVQIIPIMNGITNLYVCISNDIIADTIADTNADNNTEVTKFLTASSFLIQLSCSANIISLYLVKHSTGILSIKPFAAS